MKKFFLTGAAGFVSKYFVEYLNKENVQCEIIGCGKSKECNYHFPNFKYIQLDLRDKQEIFSLLNSFNPDYIVHLASVSSVSQSWEFPVASFVNNTNIFLNLIETVRELKLSSRILSVGSSEEYGNYAPSFMPLKETYELKPNNPYSVARVSQEMLSKLYCESFDIDVVMTRSFNHLGPGQKETFAVPSFIKQLCEIAKKNAQNSIDVGDINIVRDFLDVRDVVDAYYKILENGVKGEVYNVCSGEGVKLSSIINHIAEKLNVNPTVNINQEKIRPSDNYVIIGDNTKLCETLGWTKKYTLNRTLDDMIEHQRKSDGVLN